MTDYFLLARKTTRFRWRTVDIWLIIDKKAINICRWPSFHLAVAVLLYMFTCTTANSVSALLLLIFEWWWAQIGDLKGLTKTWRNSENGPFSWQAGRKDFSIGTDWQMGQADGPFSLSSLAHLSGDAKLCGRRNYSGRSDVAVAADALNAQALVTIFASTHTIY